MNYLINIASSIRKNVLKISHKAKSSHVGSSLSIVELLVSIYIQIIFVLLQKYFNKN